VNKDIENNMASGVDDESANNNNNDNNEEKEKEKEGLNSNNIENLNDGLDIQNIQKITSSFNSTNNKANLNDNNKEDLNLSGGKFKNRKGGSSKGDMEKAASLVVKICGNMSILVNQLVPSNFNEYWNILKPLFKDKYKSAASSDGLKEKLFDIVVTRDNIGESMWYIYTGILICSIVQFKIASVKCSSISGKGTTATPTTTTPTTTTTATANT
jgi:hypothetical protein